VHGAHLPDENGSAASQPILSDKEPHFSASKGQWPWGVAPVYAAVSRQASFGVVADL
jgi:hypothetical protein